MSNDLIYDYITGIHDKRIVASCNDMYHVTFAACEQSEFSDYYLVYYPPIIVR